MSAPERAELRFICTATDEEVREQFRELVAAAVSGDLHAIGAIAIVCGPELWEEARRELGKGREHEAWDALQQFFVAMTEGTTAFPAGAGDGVSPG